LSIDTSKTNRHERKLFLILFLVTVLSFLYFCTNIFGAPVDIDMYYIIRNGQDMLKYGIQHENIWSYIPGQKIIIQQWLYCIIMGGMYKTFGGCGIYAIACITMTLFVLSSVWFFREIGFGGYSAIVVTGISYIAFNYNGVRPELLTCMLVTLQCAAVERYLNTKHKRWLYVMPLTVLAEINLHGALWPIHFIMFIPYLLFLPEKLKKYFPKIKNRNVCIKDSVIPVILSVTALFINPYGVDGITYIIKSSKALEDYGKMISELNATSLTVSAIPFIILIWFIVILVMSEDYDLQSFFIIAGITLLMFLKVRNLGFIFPMLFYNIYETEKVWHNRTEGKVHILKKGFLRLGCILLGICIFFFIIVGYALRARSIMLSFTNPSDAIVSPVKAVKWIEKNDSRKSESISILCDHNDGPYLEFKGYKVSSDSRPEIWTKAINGKHDIKEDLLCLMYPMQYYEKRNYPELYSKLIKKYKADYVCSDAFNSLFDYMMIENPDYELVVKGKGYTLFRYTGN